MKATRFEFGEELIRLGKEHKDFVVCNPDTQSCGLENFDQVYPGRAYTFGIAEQDLLAAAAGMASCGNKVYVPTFAVFLTMRACEQIRQFICYPDQDVTLLATHTGLQVGKDGGTHIACEDVGIMRSMANMTVLQPSDGISARQMAEFSLQFHTPLYIRLHRSETPVIHDKDYRFQFGKADVLLDDGDDVALVATGVMVHPALQAAELLREQGVHAKVIDVQTIKPIDRETLAWAAERTRAVVTVEDHNIYGGLGSAAAEALAATRPTRMRILGIPDVFGESADPKELYEMHGLTAGGIAKEAAALVKEVNG